MLWAVAWKDRVIEPYIVSQGCVRYGIPVPGGFLAGVPNLTKCRVPVSKKYPTYRSVGYWYRTNTELTEVSGSGIEKIPNLPRHRVPASRLHGTKTGTSGTVVEGMPVFGVFRLSVSNLPNCRVPVLKN